MVRWTAPTHNGGSPIRRYEIEVRTVQGNKQSGTIRTAPASAAQLTVTGLTNGVAYRFRIRAVNAKGAGTWSAATAAATPRTTPAAPAKVATRLGSAGGQLTAIVGWTAGGTGGSPLTGFRVTAQRLSATGTVTGTPIVLTVPAGTRTTTVTAPSGTRPGTRYRITVQQLNAAGAGPGRITYTAVR